MITQEEIHENAKNKGAWEGKSASYSRKIGMIHSEISEVLEECRDNRGLTEIWYNEKGKPEGISIELADIVIRTMDLAEHYGFSVEEFVYWEGEEDSSQYSDEFEICISALHSSLPAINYYGSIFNERGVANMVDLESLVFNVNQICQKFGIDLKNAIKIKHQYNLTRPYKHGKNFL